MDNQGGDYKILVVENSEEAVLDLKNAISNKYQMMFVSSPQQALTVIEKECFSVIITELEFPLMDGIEFCRKIREELKLDSIVIFNSQKDENYIQLAAYKAGADDYLIKPFNSRLFMSKLEVWTKRTSCCVPEKAAPDNEAIKIDKDRYVVEIKGKEQNLPPKEFQMIQILAASPGKVFSRLELRNRVWGDDLLNNRTIDVHIRKLREKFGKSMIKTVKGVGYKLEIK